MEAAHVVLGTVDHVRFHRREGFAQRHRRRVGTEQAHQVDEDVRGGHPHLQPVQVLGHHDRVPGAVEAAAAGVVDRQADQVTGLEAAQHRLADRAIQDPAQVLHRIEHVGQAQRLGQREGIVQGAGEHPGDVDDAVAGHVDRLGLAAKLAGMVEPDLQAPVGLLFQGLADPAHRLDGGIVGHVHVGGRQDARAVAGGRVHGRCQCAAGGDQRQGTGRTGTEQQAAAAQAAHAAPSLPAATAWQSRRAWPAKSTRACWPAVMSWMPVALPVAI